jgi:hypothetical protein
VALSSQMLQIKGSSSSGVGINSEDVPFWKKKVKKS